MSKESKSCPTAEWIQHVYQPPSGGFFVPSRVLLRCWPKLCRTGLRHPSTNGFDYSSSEQREPTLTNGGLRAVQHVAGQGAFVNLAFAATAVSPIRLPVAAADQKLALVRDCSQVLAPRPTCTDAALASLLRSANSHHTNPAWAAGLPVATTDIT